MTSVMEFPVVVPAGKTGLFLPAPPAVTSPSVLRSRGHTIDRWIAAEIKRRTAGDACLWWLSLVRL